ncbi:MAG: exodeoxyribonuclease VII small subunit [Desulfovibrio sp.]|uniref:exodeoxyribonuclease VII small subunit n=1 Tax=Desulfovibrio sp. TaxID=885 RepID=UPI001A7329A7|nr:exodeoxyribonuclease VII small subunit [Desulfovibrio sp.]MBD5417842.1 exodeoxyribonuclease VII small subunit [Desulfovibrio sp.]
MKSKKPARFEEAMTRLQEIVTALEDGQQPLEQGIALYKEGAALSRFCREQLEKARHEISVWQEGEAVPFAGLESEEEEGA